MLNCEYCGNCIPDSWSKCPHCARPSLFPNVRKALDEIEQTALKIRFDEAVKKAIDCGVQRTLEQLETVAKGSKAVINRDYTEVLRLLTSSQQVYASHYELLNVTRLPEGSDWDTLRAWTDNVLFPGYFKEIRFAALSSNGVGLVHYGNCTLVLADSLIAHRATVFEKNSVKFFEEIGLSLTDPRCPTGFRATWMDRSKLAVAKLSAYFASASKMVDWDHLLLQHTDDAEDVDFIEVHIFGTITGKAVENAALQDISLEEPIRDAVQTLLDHHTRKEAK